MQQQQVKLAEMPRMCQTTRDALLREERRCIDEITSDRLAIEKMEEFNAKSIQDIRPIERSDRQAFIGRGTALEISSKSLGESVEERREYLDALQLHRQKERRHVEEHRQRISKLQRDRENHWQRISQLRDEHIKRHSEFVQAHEEFLAKEVKKRIALNKTSVAECEVQRKRQEDKVWRRVSNPDEDFVID